MSRESHEIALQAWMQTTLGVTCIYSDQDGPRPPKPYATLLVLGGDAIGQTAGIDNTFDLGSDSIDVTYTKWRNGEVSVQCFGDSHHALARSLENSLDRESVQDTNADAGLVVAFVSTAARRLSTTSNNVTEDRTRVEFAFRYADIQTERINTYIATLEATGNFE